MRLSNQEAAGLYFARKRQRSVYFPNRQAAVNLTSTKLILPSLHTTRDDAGEFTLSMFFRLNPWPTPLTPIWTLDRDGDGEALGPTDAPGLYAGDFGNVTQLYFETADEPYTNVLSSTTAAAGSAADWHHLMIAVKTNFAAGSKTMQLRVDGADIGTPADANAAFTTPFNGAALLFPALNIDLAEFWLGLEYIDIDVAANRSLFVDANGSPMDLGLRGEQPTGTSPEVYLSGNKDSFKFNKGTAGRLLELTGTLGSATAAP